jgi:transposase-like protein
MDIRNEVDARAWVREWEKDGGMRIGILQAAIAGMKTCVGLTSKTPNTQAEYQAALAYLEGELAELEIKREQAARDRERLEEARQELAEARMDRIANGYRHW